MSVFGRYAYHAQHKADHKYAVEVSENRTTPLCVALYSWTVSKANGASATLVEIICVSRALHHHRNTKLLANDFLLSSCQNEYIRAIGLRCQLRTYKRDKPLKVVGICKSSGRRHGIAFTTMGKYEFFERVKYVHSSDEKNLSIQRNFYWLTYLHFLQMF